MPYLSDGEDQACLCAVLFGVDICFAWLSRMDFAVFIYVGDIDVAAGKTGLFPEETVTDGVKNAPGFSVSVSG